MKKILFVFGSLERAGAQLRTLAVCRELRQRHQIECDFCSLQMGPTQLEQDIAALGGRIFHIPIKSPSFFSTFSRHLRQEKYDVVNGEPKMINGVLMWQASRHNIPQRITSFRNVQGHKGVLANPVFTRLMRSLIARYATDVVAVSNAALDSMYPPDWQKKAACRVIYNGLDNTRFILTPQATRVRHEFGWDDDVKLLINVARFSEQKNHSVMLKAVRQVADQREDVRLLLVGDGRLRNDITQLIADLSLEDVCVLSGIRQDVPRLLSAADLFFFPSLWEGLPGALLEALASGLPAITSDIRPNQEVAQFFPQAITRSPTLDAAQYAAAILQQLDKNVDRRQIQKQFEASPFSLNNSVNEYENLYGLN